MTKLVALAGLASLLCAAADAPPSPLLLPNGPWLVEAEENMCLLTRSYGPTGAKVVIGLQPLFTHSSLEMVLLTPDSSVDRRVGEVSVTLRPNGREIRGRYFSIPLPDGKRFARLTIESRFMGELGGASELFIKAKDLAIRVQLAAVPKALTAFEGCQRELLASWGIDPAMVSPGRAPKPRSIERLFQVYPDKAERARLSGRVVTVLQIDRAGKVGGCRVVAGAGQVLNEATCAAAGRASFDPARDDAGRAVPSIYVLPVRWILP